MSGAEPEHQVTAETNMNWDRLFMPYEMKSAFQARLRELAEEARTEVVAEKKKGAASDTKIAILDFFADQLDKLVVEVEEMAESEPIEFVELEVPEEQTEEEAVEAAAQVGAFDAEFVEQVTEGRVEEEKPEEPGPLPEETNEGPIQSEGVVAPPDTE